MSTGWLKLHRELIDKPIWLNSTIEQRTILITLLCMANHKPKQWEWKGQVYTVKAGQFITSVQSIMDRCNSKEITRQKVRTALVRFEKLEFLTIETTKQNSLITIVNWEKYQGFDTNDNQQNNQQVTNEQPTDNQHVTTNNNDKNIKNDNNVNNSQSVYHNTLDNIPTPPPSPTIDQTGQTDSFDLMKFLTKLKLAINYNEITSCYENGMIDNIVDLIIDIVATNGDRVVIGGKTYPKVYLADKLLTLDREKIDFLVDKQKSIGISEDVRNPKRYMQGIILSAALNYNTEFQSYFNKTYYNKE